MPKRDSSGKDNNKDEPVGGCLFRSWYPPIHANRGDLQVGAKALRGEEEFIHGKVFDAVDADRTIRCKGKLIQVYDPTQDASCPPYWEYEDENRRETGLVPKYHEVRVVKAHVAFI